MRFAAAAAIFLALPFVVFRGRLLRRWLTFDAFSYAFAAIIWRFIRDAAVIDSVLVSSGFFAVKLAVFGLYLARASAHEVRWSAARGAVIAALLYGLVIPGMIRVPIDGDEPFYLLMTESLVHDGDLDLSNQYGHLELSASGRRDLRPQPGDTETPRGEQRSRLEPFLPVLMTPGYAIGRLPGAIAIIALLGALLVRSTIRFLEDEGISDDVIRAVFPFFAFAPPVLYFATRIWAEVPGALGFLEVLRGVRQRRPQRWAPALLFLGLLKLRFLLVAIVPFATAMWQSRRVMRVMLIAAGILVTPLALMWLVTGRAMSVHRWSEFVPRSPLLWYAHGFFGLMLDGMSGIAFQAPFYLLGIFAMTHWRRMPAGFRLGCLALVPYLITLTPRAEWHGGWAPPLRYIVVAMPVLALGAAAIWDRVGPSVVAVLAVFTTGLVAYGITYPWRLFHIANGESAAGEALSTLYKSDFSRLVPSFIWPNTAALVAAIALLVALALWRAGLSVPRPLIAPALLIAIAAAFAAGREPGRRIDFENAHVVHRGGELYPELYQISRFMYHGGWIVRPGDSVSFLALAGPSTLRYLAKTPAVIELGGHAFTLPATGEVHGYAAVRIDRSGRVELRCVEGVVNLDRMEHE